MSAVEHSTDTAPAARRERRGLTIRVRLHLAFTAVAGMTVLASAVAFVSYTRVGATLAEITGESIPAIKTSLGLAKESAEIAAAAPRLANAGSHADTQSALKDLQAKQAELNAQVDAMAKSAGGAASAETLRRDSGRLQKILEGLAATVGRGLDLKAQREGSVGKMLAAHRTLGEKLAPLADDAGFALVLGLQTATEDKDVAAIDKKLSALSDNEVAVLNALHTVRADVNLIAGLLNEAATAPRKELLPPIVDRFSAASAHVANALNSLKDDAAESASLKPLAAALVAFGKGEAGLFEVRQRELDAALEAAKLVDEARSVASALGRQVDELVQAADGASKGSADASTAAIDQGRFLLVAIAVVSLLASLLIGWLYVGRNVARRLHALREAMLAVAGGDFNAAIPEGGSDEISQMAKSLAVFRDNGQAAEEARERAAAERREMAATRRNELLALAGRFEASVKLIVETVSGAATELKASAEQMVGTARETFEQVTAASASSSAAAESASSVAAATDELSSSTAEIGRRVTQSTEIAGRAVAEAEHTNATVRDLADAAQKIGEVVQLISDIAGQTNLLALNATIEAARAGEAGKGFAVVASEVKSLASQTAKATEEIAAQIGRIQSATNGAVKAIESIGATISAINEISTSISSAVQEQGATTAEIARTVQNAAESSGSVSQNIGGVTRAADETGQAANHVLSSADDLAKQSALLQQEVERFLDQVRAA